MRIIRHAEPTLERALVFWEMIRAIGMENAEKERIAYEQEQAKKAVVASLRTRVLKRLRLHSE